ncbi:MAG: NAD-dependent epimerase/dehydratase family protein [Actinomycetota bacterium]|nr:NAD-dependent epimerase/dehydratase family protein [Actinomycetota bacterium]
MRLAPVRVLIAGGAGFIGAELAGRLLAEGHAVEVVDDLSGGSLANLAEARRSGGAFRFHQLDVTARACSDLVAHLRPDVVFHLAGARPSLCRADPPRDVEITVVGLLRLLEGARAASTRKVVMASSWTCYGELAPAELPAHEHLAMRPLSPHGIAKRSAVEYLAAARERHGIEFSALVLSSVYGPGQLASDEPGCVARFARAAASGRPLRIEGDGSQTRDFLYVDDAVDALSRAAERGSGLVLNVGTGRPTAINELAARFAAAVASPLAIERAPARPDESAHIALDPARALIHLGWRPFTPLEAGVAALFEAAAREQAAMGEVHA